MKRLRRRRASGRTVLPVEVDDVDLVEKLLVLELLAPDRTEDRGAIARATARLLATLQVGDVYPVTRNAMDRENL
jgi:hypothetical protein